MSTPDPTADEIAEMAMLAAAHVRRFGIEPKIALLSHSDFGSLRQRIGAQDARGARHHLRRAHPELEVDGEMHGDSALSRRSASASSRIRG